MIDRNNCLLILIVGASLQILSFAKLSNAFIIAQDSESVLTYDAPLAHHPFEKLPKLEDFFGGTIPNHLQLLLRALALPSSEVKKFKWCYLLYGPLEADLCAIAQIVVRTAGLEIIYANSPDCKAFYNGAFSKARIEALFSYAQKIRFQTGKPVVIIINNVDRWYGEPNPPGHTEDSSRRLKSLGLALDRHRNDAGIYVLCTTHKLDQVDPAIIRRSIAIEIPKPAGNFSLLGSMSQLKNAILSWFKRSF